MSAKGSILVLFLINLFLFTLKAQTKPMNIYLIPGQGGDYRLFNNLDFDESVDVKYVHFETPAEGVTIKDYARVLATQIDTTSPFVLVGVSLGGMIATEMTEFLTPEKTIIISSAKTRNELPGRYRFQQNFPLYKLVSSSMAKVGAQILQPIVEPDRRKEKETFKSMLKAKDPEFLRRTIGMIINWSRAEYPKTIVHIHGNKDKTIPIRNVEYHYLVKGGSHMMVLTRGEEISQILHQILRE